MCSLHERIYSTTLPELMSAYLVAIDQKQQSERSATMQVFVLKGRRKTSTPSMLISGLSEFYPIRSLLSLWPLCRARGQHVQPARSATTSQQNTDSLVEWVGTSARKLVSWIDRQLRTEVISSAARRSFSLSPFNLQQPDVTPSPVRWVSVAWSFIHLANRQLAQRATYC